jgi:hypothetical protein
MHFSALVRLPDAAVLASFERHSPILVTLLISLNVCGDSAWRMPHTSRDFKARESVSDVRMEQNCGTGQDAREQKVRQDLTFDL